MRTLPADHRMTPELQPVTMMPVNRSQALEALRREKPGLVLQYGVRRLALFGSTSRDEARPGSDVDVLVDFDGPVTLDRYMGVKFRLEDVLGSRVDLVTESGLRPRARPLVESDAVDVA